MASNKSNRFKGVWTALVTPFDTEGQIDFDAFQKLVESQLEAGIAGLVVSGTTGEAPTLNSDEKLKLVQKCRDIAGPEANIMAGTGGSSTEASIKLSLAALEAGADSLLIATPPYNKPSIEGLGQHFEAIAQQTQAHICLYHVPGRTAQKLTAAQLAKLAEIPQVSAIKEASADLALFADATYLCKAALMSGDDPTYLASLGVGATGCISVASNIVPEAMVAMTAAAASQSWPKAQALNAALFPLIKALFIEANPAPVKYLLAESKIGSNTFRLPVCPMTSNNAEKVKTVYHSVSEELRKWL